jgi:hypothetical protein
MCEPSKVYEDWVVKGFHIYVNAIELVLRPTYTGGIVFKKWFSSTPDDVADAAIRFADAKCLPDAAVRARWIRDLRRAMPYVRFFPGEPKRKANGRQFEFLRLIQALERYGAKHGNS